MFELLFPTQAEVIFSSLLVSSLLSFDDETFKALLSSLSGGIFHAGDADEYDFVEFRPEEHVGKWVLVSPWL